jgi:hypothetical protein
MIIINLEQSDKNTIEKLLKDNGIESEIIDKKNFNGQSEIIELICTLSTVSLPIIAKIIVERIRSRKYIEVKHKGLIIKGLSEENTVKILEKLIGKK